MQASPTAADYGRASPHTQGGARSAPTSASMGDMHAGNPHAVFADPNLYRGMYSDLHGTAAPNYARQNPAVQQQLQRIKPSSAPGDWGNEGPAR
jgi:hypothetical protein